MTLFTRSLWPETVRRPYLRLAAAVVAAPLLLATVFTLLAFLIAGSTEPDRAATLAVTGRAAVAFFAGLTTFTLTLGVAGIALLWASGKRGLRSWLGIGAAAGAAVAIAQALLVTGRVSVAQTAFAVVSGLIIFALIRWIAGVRAG